MAFVVSSNQSEASFPEVTANWMRPSLQLTELSKRYSGFVHTKALHGLRLAFRIQSYIQVPDQAIRGYVETSVVGFDEMSGTYRVS